MGGRGGGGQQGRAVGVNADEGAGVAMVVSKAEPSASPRTMGGRGDGGQQGRAVGVNADDGWAWRWWSARPSRRRQRGRGGGRGDGGQQGRAVGVTADDGRAWRRWSARRAVGVNADDGWAWRWWSARPSRGRHRRRWAGLAAVVSKAEPWASPRTRGGRGGGGQQGERSASPRTMGGRGGGGHQGERSASQRTMGGRGGGVIKASGRRQRGRWAGVAAAIIKASGQRQRGRWAGVAAGGQQGESGASPPVINECGGQRQQGGVERVTLVIGGRQRDSARPSPPGLSALQAAGRRSRRPGPVVDADPPCPEGRGWPVARRATQIGPRAERPSPLGIPYGASEASDRGVPGVGGPGGRGAAGGAAAKACSQGDRRMWPRQLSDVGARARGRFARRSARWRRRRAPRIWQPPGPPPGSEVN